MSREQKNALVTVTVRLPLKLAEAMIIHKLRHGITVQKLVAEAISEKLCVHPQTGKPVPKEAK